MPTMMQVCKRIGLQQLSDKRKIAFDYAIPQPWADDVREKTGIYPVGNIVWLYDENGILGPKCGLFGRPYSITLFGWQILRLYFLQEGHYV